MSVLASALEHSKRHVKYPASKKQLMEACNNMSDMPKAEEDWFTKTFPTGSTKMLMKYRKPLWTRSKLSQHFSFLF